MRIDLRPSQRGKLNLTFSLQQAFRILQMPQYELGQWLLSEIEKNPLLEWEEIRSIGSSHLLESIEAPKSFYAALAEQVREHFPDIEQRQLAFSLLDNLDERGYLSPDVQDAKTQNILPILQTFDPPGIFASDLRECLLLQLPPASPAYQIVQHGFQDLLKGKWKKIEKLVGKENLSCALKVLSSKTRRPKETQDLASSPSLIPDLSATKIDDQWRLESIEDALPKIQIRADYLKLKPLSSEEKNILQNWKSSAISLVHALQRRKQILLKVGNFLVKTQNGFLEQTEDLKPLKLKELATKLNLHESTLSRALCEKSIQTPTGIFPLRSFLSSDPNIEKAKRALQLLIQQETPKSPLSDEKIAKHLEEQGFHLARRTVAKYRKTLKILPASRRNQNLLTAF